MEINTTACNLCGRLKRETNHWIKAYTSPYSRAILFAPADEAIDPRGYIVEDLCGQQCAAKRQARWFASLAQPSPPSPPHQESVTA